MPSEQSAASGKRIVSTRSRLIKEHFAAAFRRHIELGHDPSAVAIFLQKSPASIYRYCSGTHKPPLGEIERICAQLGWNFEELASPVWEISKLFEQQQLNFDTLYYRYADRRRLGDVSGAQQIAIQSFGLLYGTLCREGIPCYIQGDPCFNMVFTFPDTPWGLYVLILKPTPEQIEVEWRCTEAGKAQMLAKGISVQANEVYTYPLTNEKLGALLRRFKIVDDLTQKDNNGESIT